MNRKARITALTLLTIIPLLVTSCIVVPQIEPTSTSEPETEPVNEQYEEVFILSENVHFAPLTDDCTYYRDDDIALDYYLYPFEECGRHFSEPFFVNTDETIKLILETECPIPYERLESNDQQPGGLLPYIPMCKRNDSGGFYEVHSFLQSYSMIRSGDTWQVEALFQPMEPGMHILFLCNLSGIATDCYYEIFIQPGKTS